MPDKRSWAHEHAREFELLTLELMRDQFGVPPETVRVTRFSGDGGYDVICEVIDTRGSLFELRRLLLCEAKLRTARTDSINADVFAKAVLIAYDNSADAIVLVTNCRFSETTLQNLAVFDLKSNVKVRGVDGPTLSGWVRRHLDRLVQYHAFDEGFLRDLLWSEVDEAQARREIVITARADLGKGVTLTIGEQRFIQETGWNGKDMADCLLIAQPPSALKPEPAEDLAGNDRRVVADRLVRALARSRGIARITGLAGVGKTVVVDHVAAALARERRFVGRIDLAQVTDDRGFFLRLLSAVLAADLTKLTAGESRENLVATLRMGSRVSQESADAVATLLLTDRVAYAAHSDVNRAAIIDYLRLLVANAVGTIVVFANLDRTTQELRDLALLVADQTAKAGATILFELRDLGDAVPSYGSIQEWQLFVRRVERATTLGNFRVEPLSPADAAGYLDVLLPHLGAERTKVIVDRVGTVPLYLRSAATWLEEEAVVVGTGAVVVEKLEIFYERIAPEGPSAILDAHLDLWWSESDTRQSLADVIAAAVLFNGIVSMPLLRTLRPYQSQLIAERLIHSALFVREGTGVRVVHGLMLDRMRELTVRLPFRTGAIAAALLANLDEIAPEPIARQTKEPILLRAIGRFDESFVKSRQVAEILAARKQWEASSRAYEGALADLQHIQRHAGDPEAEILIDLLEVEDQRYRLATTANTKRVAALRALFLGDDGASRAELRLRSLNIAWRHAFTQERFDTALQIAAEAVALVERHGPALDQETAGTAYGNQGISLKAIGEKQKSLEWFDDAQKRLSGSVTLADQRQSNIAAYYLTSDPARARDAIATIVSRPQPTTGVDLDWLHAKVDLAMIDFLAHDYDACAISANDALLIAEGADVLPQQARALNILGCAFWANNKVREADQRFEEACLAAERMFSNRFLWRMRTNRAGTALESGPADVALANARSAERLIIDPRRGTLAKRSLTNEELKSRWYVALVAIGSYYKRLSDEDLKRMTDDIRIPRLVADSEAVAAGNPPSDLFANTTHIHSGKIMITG